MPRHHFTVDVEEYFQVSALEPYAPVERWDSYESRVERCVDRLLALLDEQGVTGTFFTLGWIAERHAGMMRRIAEGGHEIASHGWRHQRVTTMTREEFRACVRASKGVLEDVTGRRVCGYRAPSFSIPADREWAFEVLLEEGYVYDSSLYPGRKGHRRGPRSAWDVPVGKETLREYPIATLAMGRVLPAGGGAFLRLLPYGLVRAAFRAADRAGTSATFYVHPWEIDAEQPRFPVSLKTRVRHYGGLKRTEPRIRRLLGEFAFGPIMEPEPAGAVR